MAHFTDFTSRLAARARQVRTRAMEVFRRPMQPGKNNAEPTPQETEQPLHAGVRAAPTGLAAASWRGLEGAAHAIVHAIRAGLLWLWRMLNSIQFKLAIFTGGLIALTITILSYNYVNQQTALLTDSYEREAAISRNYISSLVLELDNIVQSLIRVEEFRQRVSEQTRALKKFQTVTTTVTTVVTVEEKKREFSLFGFKTSLGGLAGTEKIEKKEEKREVKRTDNYFTNYLSGKDTEQLEKNVLLLLQQSGGAISDKTFNALKQQARKFVLADRELDVLKARLNAEPERTSFGSIDERAAELAALQERVRKQALLTRQLRSNLNNAVMDHLLDARKRKIRELGLDTGRFRIQTFSTLGLISGESPEPVLDTRLFDPNAPLSQLDVQPVLQDGLLAAFESIETNGVLSPLKSTALPMHGMQLQALYSPYFEHPSSTARARLLEEKRGTLRPRSVQEGGKVKDTPAWDWAGYVAEDSKILEQIAKIPNGLRNRLKELRGRNPPTPPFEDRVFRSEYAHYAKLIQQRNELYESWLESHPPTEEDRAHVEALGSLRDAALEDQILVRFRDSDYDVARTAASPETMAANRKRWNALREWIYAGRSETPPPALKALFPHGMIGNSRTEAEEILWKLDTTPLYSETGRNDLPQVVLGQNFAGVTRTIVDRSDGLRAIENNRDKAIQMAVFIFLAAIFLAVTLSYFSVRKIKRLIRNAERVGQGDLNVEFPTKGADEFGSLSRALDRMMGGLREREKVKSILGNMIDPVVVGEAMKDMAALKRGSEERVTAFFSDVAGFSSISEKLSSVELASLLNEYLSAMTVILKEHEGVLDKYIGDAIVGIFNAPVPVENHCLKAVRASLKMLGKMEELRAVWKREQRYIPEVQEMHFRIGLNTGPAKVGFMGTDALASYTMMGDTVNLAARLEAAGKDYGVPLLISDAVYEEVKNHVFARKLDFVRVKGKSEPVVLYEAIAEHDAIEKAELGSALRQRQAAARLYEEGLDLYLKREWDAAILKFRESERTLKSRDEAAQMLIERCAEYQQTPPPADWDGAYTREHK